LALADAEFLMRLPTPAAFADGSLALRGIGPPGVAMRPALKVIGGQMFRAGHRELIVGKGASRKFGLVVGSKVQLVDGDWPVVGVFTDGGDILESYLVGDSDTIMDATRRHGYAQVLAQLANPRDYRQFAMWLTRNPQLGVSVERKVDYDRRQVGAQTDFFTHMAYLIGAIMALGAMVGVVKIMYAAVRSRTREIGTLRALGFGPVTVAASVLAEAVLLGIIGGLIGTGLAWAIFDGREMWIWGSFRLHVSADLLALGLGWATLSSLLGGLVPAIRAARIPAYEALRAA
jgi:putative ABC transport system permease protein